MFGLDALHKVQFHTVFVFLVLLLPVGEEFVFHFQEIADVAQTGIHVLQGCVLVQDPLDFFVLRAFLHNFGPRESLRDACQLVALLLLCLQAR